MKKGPKARRKAGKRRSKRRQKLFTLAEARLFLNRKFASVGGKARKEALSPERRREIAKKAIETRWARRKAKGNA